MWFCPSCLLDPPISSAWLLHRAEPRATPSHPLSPRVHSQRSFIFVYSYFFCLYIWKQQQTYYVLSLDCSARPTNTPASCQCDRYQSCTAMDSQSGESWPLHHQLWVLKEWVQRCYQTVNDKALMTELRVVNSPSQLLMWQWQWCCLGTQWSTSWEACREAPCTLSKCWVRRTVSRVWPSQLHLPPLMVSREADKKGRLGLFACSSLQGGVN